MQYKPSIITFFILLKLAIHLPFNGRYGYHADELLYIAMSDQMAWGYKEGPPLISLLTWLSLQLSENSLWVLRLLPTICGAAIIGVTGLMTKMLGGGHLAVGLACTAILLDPSFLATGYMMQPVVFDQLTWALCCYFFIRFLKTSERSNLFYCGIMAGLGMMNKFSIALYIGSLLVALLLQDRRKMSFKDLLCLVLPGLIVFLPHLLWQINNGFPFIAQLRELQTYYWSQTGYPTLLKQLFFSHGVSGLVCMAGLISLFGSGSMRPFRFLGISFLLIQLIFLYLQAKTYYSFGAFPVLYSAGAVLIVQFLAQWKKPLVGGLAFATIIVSGVFAMPAVIPVLPLPYTVAWLDAMKRYTGIVGPLQWDDGSVHQIPQYYAQMLGWEELAKETLNIYRSLPEGKRASTVILTDNYQQAGAISFYGKDEALATVSIRPSFFSQAYPGVSEYTILVASQPRSGSEKPSGLLSIQQIDCPNAEVNGSVIYLIRHADAIACQAR